MNHWRIWDVSVIWNFVFWDTDARVSRDLQAEAAYMTPLHSAFCQWPLWGLSDAVHIQQGALPSSLRIGVDRSLWALRQLALSSGLTLAVQQKEHWLVRSSILRKVPGRHAAGQLVQGELKARTCARFLSGVRWPPSFHHGGSEPQSINPLLPLVTSRRVWIFWTFSQSSA